MDDKFFDNVNGNMTTSSPEVMYMAFNTGNDPRDASGAELKANTVGKIYIGLQGLNLYGTGHIKWLSETCGAAPIMATLMGYYYQNYSGGRGLLEREADRADFLRVCEALDPQLRVISWLKK